MAEQKTNYTAYAAVAIAFASGMWSLINPRGDIADIKRDFALYATKELQKQDVEHLNSELRRLERDHEKLHSSSVTSTFFTWRTDQLEKQLNILRERVMKLDETVNVTYSAKDALQTMQNRITELERAARGPLK